MQPYFRVRAPSVVTMRIAEPMTMLTDYALAAIAAVLGAGLFRVGSMRRQTSVRLWAQAFVATAVAALVGGTSHGLALLIGASAQRALWKITVLSVGVASFLMLSGAILATVRRRMAPWLVGAAGLKLACYVVRMATHDDFRYAVYDYLAAMLAVFALEAHAACRGRGEGARSILAGLLVSLAAAGLQRAGFGLGEHFNHNDLYHVIQMGALWLLYRGGLSLTDTTEG